MKKIIMMVPMVLLLICSTCFALEMSTHEAINELNAPIINAQLVDIGFQKGVLDTVNERPIYKWISLGGHYEDAPPWTLPYSRSFNHYLNPINNAGYLGIFKSALEWAHSQGTFGSQFGGDYSWPTVRSYYLLALTSADKATRDNYFADTFQGVGQLMHLVSDMSVPEHTRNETII